jgi:hypothetical protein
MVVGCGGLWGVVALAETLVGASLGPTPTFRSYCAAVIASPRAFMASSPDSRRRCPYVGRHLNRTVPELTGDVQEGEPLGNHQAGVAVPQSMGCNTCEACSPDSIPERCLPPFINVERQTMLCTKDEVTVEGWVQGTVNVQVVQQGLGHVDGALAFRRLRGADVAAVDASSHVKASALPLDILPLKSEGFPDPASGPGQHLQDRVVRLRGRSDKSSHLVRAHNHDGLLSLRDFADVFESQHRIVGQVALGRFSSPCNDGLQKAENPVIGRLVDLSRGD